MLAQPGTEITSTSWFGIADAAAMAVTDGKCLARLKGCAGISARAEDAPGGPKKLEGGARARISSQTGSTESVFAYVLALHSEFEFPSPKLEGRKRVKK